MYTFFMLGIIFLVISLIAYAFGARGTAGASAGIGRTFLVVGLILAVRQMGAGQGRINRQARRRVGEPAGYSYPASSQTRLRA